MKNWKSLLAGLLAVCLIICLPSYPVFGAEADAKQEEETEEPIPDSYYYPIETNSIKNWPEGPAIESAAATVMELDSGTVLYSKNAEAKMYPASITKIMTTLLLIENCNLDDEITFSEIVYDIEEGSSHLGIRPGETMTLRDAAYGIMLESANDISNGVAEYIGGSISGFADMMNARAESLGCVNTHFANPHGLYSDNHYTCAHDMALIAAEAYRNPVFREIAGTRYYTIGKTNETDEERYLANHHKMMHKDEEYYASYVTGGKTGYTSQCLNTLVTFAEQEGQRLVSVVMRVNGAGKAYNETRAILDYGFANFSSVNYKRNYSAYTFYDIMGLAYLGKAAVLQSEVWKRSPYEDFSVAYTLPEQVTADQLTFASSMSASGEKEISYQYEGNTVGRLHGKFAPVYAPAKLSFEGESVAEAASEEVTAETETQSIQIESLDGIVAQTAAIFHSAYEKLETYTKEHTVVVAAAGAAALLLLILFLVVLIFRGTADRRIQRRRRQEEKERERREEEIERMTTAEIEAELRAAMLQERIRQEQELISEETEGTVDEDENEYK